MLKWGLPRLRLHLAITDHEFREFLKALKVIGGLLLRRNKCSQLDL